MCVCAFVCSRTCVTQKDCAAAIIELAPIKIPKIKKKNEEINDKSYINAGTLDSVFFFFCNVCRYASNSSTFICRSKEAFTIRRIKYAYIIYWH